MLRHEEKTDTSDCSVCVISLRLQSRPVSKSLEDVDSGNLRSGLHLAGIRYVGPILKPVHRVTSEMCSEPHLDILTHDCPVHEYVQ